MPLHEIVAECATMMDAGNDTRQTSLTNLMYPLAANLERQTKVCNELASTLVAENQQSAHCIELQKVLYLRACLYERFCCRPPMGFGLPRRAPVGGVTIAGHYIPADTTVSSPLYNLHHDKRLFKNPTSFVPERWLGNDQEYAASEEERQNLKDIVMSFRLGGRARIGRNLGYMELSIVIAALVLDFEWELAVPGSDVEIMERMNSNPKNLIVKGKAREGATFDAQMVS
jgi:benzoate 4-monooxygenase